MPFKPGRSTTAEEAAGDVDLNGKVAVVTGANSGIGVETARVLAVRGAKVIMACRNMEKCSLVAKDIQEKHPESKVECMPLDLTSFSSVRSFAKTYEKKKYPLHILVNNAGVMMTPKQYTEDDNELQIQSNHLGHFLLTNLLLPNLKASAPSRVVVVSSGAMRFGGLDIDDLNFRNRSYSSVKSYGQSKLANALFARELNRRCEDEGAKVTANYLHPGVIHTNLGRNSGMANIMLGLVSNLGYYLGFPNGKSVPQGAATSVYCAVAPELEGKGGLFFKDCAEDRPANSQALDSELAARLWEASAKITGI